MNATVEWTLADLIDEAANFLCMRGHLDPDADGIPADVVAELAALAEQGSCGDVFCLWEQSQSARASSLADHWEAMKQREYEQSIPTWQCDCGQVYKRLPIYGGHVDFYQLADDDLLGERVGGMTTNAKGHVKHSDKCPGCGKRFADTVTDRANPQQALF